MATYAALVRWTGWMLVCLGLLTGQAYADNIKITGNRCVPDPSCDNSTLLTFQDTLKTTKTVQSRSWDFGDPSTQSDTSTKERAQYVYPSAGTFTVRLTRTYQDGTTDSDTSSVTIGVPPPSFQNWRTDTMICQGQTITLNPYPSGAPSGVSYLWYPKGDTTKTLDVDSSGCYSVQVWYGTSGDRLKSCAYEDRINVKICGEQSQQQGAKWYFGNNAGIDFSGGSPTAIDDSKINTPEGTSSISNTKGQLLFYTDGIVIYDKDGNIMKTENPADTARLQGSPTSTQSALIVPQPTCRGCEYLYRVYTTTDINGTKQLTVSTVDMRLNGGKGEIVEKNSLVDASTTERIASVRNDRDTTYWVISRDYGNNTFQVYHVTKAGQEGPTNYALGMVQDTTTKGEGYLKIGPADSTSKGNRPLAMVVPGPPTNYLELFTFNDSTGVMTQGSRINLGPAPPKAYGVEFSPDGKKVYVTLQGDSTTASQIVSYDLSNTDSTAIANSKSVIDSTSSRTYGALQIASNGNIYVAIKDGKSVGVIENANNELLAPVKFNPNGVDLGGKTSQLGLPNMVANFNEPSSSPGFSYADTCVGSPVKFSVTPWCSPLKENHTWNWGDGSPPLTTQQNDTTHTYTRAGVYSVTLRTQVLRSDGGICKDTTITQQVTITALPDPIDLGPDIDTCSKNVMLDAKVQASMYIWLRNGQVLANDTARTLTTTLSGNFIVIAANGNCYQTDTIRVTRRNPPAFTLGPDSTICVGNAITLTANGTAWTGFQWNTGSRDRTTTVNRAGTYIVTVSSTTTGCTNSDTIVVSTLPKPTVTAFLNPPTGCGTSDGSIRLSVSSGQTQQYVWTRQDGTPIGDNTSVLANVPDGTYRVQITSSNVCTIDTTLTLRSNNSIQVTADPQTALCRVPQSGSIRVNIVSGRPTIFIWRDASGAVIDTASALTGIDAGIYSLEARDAGGCIDTLNNIRVPADTTGFVNLGPDRGKCLGDTATLASLIGQTPGDVYQWSSGQSTPSITVSTAGTYRLTIRNTRTGCVGSDAVAISFSPPPVVEAGPPLDVCANAPTFRLSGASPAGGYWTGRNVDSTGRFTPADSLAGTTPLVLTYTASQQGCSASDRLLIFVRQIPTVELGPDTTLCPSPSYRLQAIGSAGTTYQWSTGETTASINPTQSGTYSVRATTGVCSATDDVRITFKPLPTYRLTKEVPLCVSDAGTAQVQVSGTGNLYFWPQQGVNTPSITVSQTGSYVVEILGSNGCTAIDTANVVDQCEPRVLVPDAFTPNGDGENDRLDVFTAYITDFSLKIYNRWGEVIFASNDPEQKWDGTYRGEKYPSMVYAYSVSYKSAYFPDRAAVVKRGSVLLIR